MMDKFIKKLEELEEKVKLLNARTIELEGKAKLLNARTIELQAQIFELNPNIQKWEDPPDTLQGMEYELRFWQDQRGLPHTSADEVDRSKLLTREREWLDRFIERWDYHANRYDA